VDITPIGHTAEGRRLEILRVGDAEAPHQVLLRARAHPWEPGGNRVVQGLVLSLLEDSRESRRCLERICVAVLPMAGKDGVARGRTRFNSRGMDLNRNWERPADPTLAPENHALEAWLETEIASGRRPDLAIDLHNDNSGKLHVSHSRSHGARHRANMHRLERLLVEHTWFSEGTCEPSPASPWTFGDGLLERYGIDACVLELNCDWIARLNRVPFGADWELLGRQMRNVLAHYCA
jgi:hypothetical protein